MSKLFTEFSVQPNTSPFPKIPAKNSNVLWLSSTVITCCPSWCVCPAQPWPDSAVPVLHPLNPLAHRGPLATPEGTAQHAVHQRWQISALAVRLVTTVATRPCQGSGHGGPGCLWGVTACLNHGPALNSDRTRPLFCFASCSSRGCSKVSASKRTLLWQVLLKATTFQTQEGEEEGTLVGSSKSCFLWCLEAALQCCGLWSVEHLLQQPAVLVSWRRGEAARKLPCSSCPPPSLLVRGLRWGNPAPALAAGSGGAKLLFYTPHITTEGTVWEEKPGAPLKCAILPPQWEHVGIGFGPYHNHWSPSCFCWNTVTRYGDAKKWWKCESREVLNRHGGWWGEGEVGGDPNPAESIEWSWKESSQTKLKTAQQRGWKAAAIVELTSSTPEQ